MNKDNRKIIGYSPETGVPIYKEKFTFKKLSLASIVSLISFIILFVLALILFNPYKGFSNWDGQAQGWMIILAPLIIVLYFKNAFSFSKYSIITFIVNIIIDIIINKKNISPTTKKVLNILRLILTIAIVALICFINFGKDYAKYKIG